jgi:hypothetical protein
MSGYDEQIARIQAVFTDLDEIPQVSEDCLEHYLNWLKERLTVPCLLTGIESMGYFAWEEPYDFGYGSLEDYEEARKKRASYRDQYELKSLDKAKIGGSWESDILVPVVRAADKKRFTIPLSELEAVDEDSKNYQLLNDYTVWYVNWRE